MSEIHPNTSAMTSRYRSRGQVIVTCPRCREQRPVRADSTSGPFKHCRRCNSSIAGSLPKPSRRLGREGRCEECGAAIYIRPSESATRFCSKECHDAHRRVYPVEERTCRNCDRPFRFNAKPYSNVSGTYCSRACRDAGYMGYYRGWPAHGYHGSRVGWRSIRDGFLAAGNRSCKSCGKTSCRLYVHHVEPYRVAKNNDFSNLVTLCGKCHAAAESLSDWIEGLTSCHRPEAIRIVQQMIAEGIRGKANLWRSAESRLASSTSTPPTPGAIRIVISPASSLA